MAPWPAHRALSPSAPLAAPPAGGGHAPVHAARAAAGRRPRRGALRLPAWMAVAAGRRQAQLSLPGGIAADAVCPMAACPSSPLFPGRWRLHAASWRPTPAACCASWVAPPAAVAAAAAAGGPHTPTSPACCPATPRTPRPLRPCWRTRVGGPRAAQRREAGWAGRGRPRCAASCPLPALAIPKFSTRG